jgi:5-methylthioadenosine/S-adenosylhomocysteine deaminase
MDASLTPAREILKMATLSGARAQGRRDTGLIKPGYKADLAVLRLDRPHLSPLHDVLGGALFSAQASDVEMTVVNGAILYRDGEFLTFDAREAMKNVAAAAKRIARELNL